MYLLPTEILAAINDRVVEPVYFAYVDWVGGEVRTHTHLGEILFDGYTWYGVGSYGKIGQVSNDSNLGAHSVELTLSGIDPLTLNEVVTKDCIGRTVTLYVGFIDSEGQLIGAIQYFDGRISDISIKRFTDDIITIRAVDKLADWAKSRSDRYTHDSYVHKPEGDHFFQYVDEMVERTLSFGGEKDSIPLRPREP